MTDYIYQDGYFRDKDSLPPLTPEKEIKGVEFEDQFTGISAAIVSKLNKANPSFTGTMIGPAITLSGTLKVNLITGGTF